MENVHFYLELQNHAQSVVGHDQPLQHSPAFLKFLEYFFSILVSQNFS